MFLRLHFCRLWEVILRSLVVVRDSLRSPVVAHVVLLLRSRQEYIQKLGLEYEKSLRLLDSKAT
jgi:hypothetical protein